MKALAYYRYGEPLDVLKFEEREKPKPGPNEVLIDVKASSINPFDWRHIKADPFLVRLSGGGFSKPVHNVLGADIAGVVVETGSDVAKFKDGDEVFGEIGYGGYAEFAVASQDRLAIKPKNLTFVEAASLPMAALTAYQGIRDVAPIRKGDKVLVNGASGGIGTICVQLACYMGASEVVGICSTRNVKMVKKLGASEVIDYTTQNIAEAGKFDVILETVGNLSTTQTSKLLRSGGKSAIIGFTNMSRLIGVQFGNMGLKLVSNKRIALVMAKPSGDDLAKIGQLYESGHLKIVLDQVYKFDEAPEAMAYAATKRARGKVVLEY